jgi:hypothetical protein
MLFREAEAESKRIDRLALVTAAAVAVVIGFVVGIILALEWHWLRQFLQEVKMSGPTKTFDQADEDILTYTVSDEAVEAAAGFLPATVSDSVCLSCMPGCQAISYSTTVM